MAKPRKPSKAKEAKVQRDIARIMAATQPAGELSATEQYRRSMSATAKQAKLDEDLPWRHSYANWCMHLGAAAAKYNARIDYGSDTYEAWETGTSPDTYARDRSRR